MTSQTGRPPNAPYTRFDNNSRVIAHIPDKHFRVVRYYNWLSNRTRKTLLPLVYQALGQIVKKLKDLSWRELIINNFGTDPLICPHCVYTNSVAKLKQKHQKVVSPQSYLSGIRE